MRLHSIFVQRSLKRLLLVSLCLGVIGHASVALAKFKPKKGIGRPIQRIGLASRGRCGMNSPTHPLTALVPTEGSFTAKQKPNILWYMPKHTFPSVEFRLFSLSDNGMSIIHRKVFENLPQQQIVNYNLEQVDVPLLEADEVYMWQVHLVCNPDVPTGNIFASGMIEYEAPSTALQRQISLASDLQKADLWLENGYWYEGVQSLWMQTQNESGRSVALAAWQELMTDELVNLPHLATFEHGGVD